MVFSSTIFLCVYLPLVLLGYYICPKKGRNLFLLIVSLVFYAWGEPKYVFLMIFSILVNYIFGRLMDKNRGRQKRMKLMLVLSVVIDLGLLSVFKYTDFIITNVNAIFGSSFDLLKIALPIGISFYTFQAMSYTIDVYRELDGAADEEDIYLDEFRDEIDEWVIDAIKGIGIDTAKGVLNAPREMLIEKADLEEDTVDEVLRILKAEFEE